MEFERAIFRVYERCLDGLRDDTENNENDSKGCRFLELLTFGLGAFFLLTLVILHKQFVGSAGCLPFMLADANNITTGSPFNVSMLLRNDQFLNLNVDRKFTPTKDNDEDTGNLRRLSAYQDFIFVNELDKTSASDTAVNNISNVAKDFAAPFDYQFSFEIGELFLPVSIRRAHHFET